MLNLTGRPATCDHTWRPGVGDGPCYPCWAGPHRPALTAALCHPARRHRALGLCGSCYIQSRPDYGLRKSFTPRQRAAILATTDGHCAYCGIELSLQTMTVDHRKPLIRGGTDDPANLTAACRPCNARKWAD
jgi:5-methylcytosine-specific restriction endonuclease McrA